MKITGNNKVVSDTGEFAHKGNVRDETMITFAHEVIQSLKRFHKTDGGPMNAAVAFGEIEDTAHNHHIEY